MFMFMVMMIVMMMYSCYSKMDRASIRVIDRPVLEIPYFYPPSLLKQDCTHCLYFDRGD